MPRKRKHDVKVNDNESLEGLMQETYNDACLQINDVQRTINELTTGANPDGVDDLTKIAKEKGNLLKVKDSAIRVKLEIANGNVSLSDFKSIREMFKKGHDIDNEMDEE